MFGLFNSNYEPLDYDTRKWYEYHFKWLTKEFKDFKHEERQVYVPSEQDFPVHWDHSEESAWAVLTIIAGSLKIALTDLQLDFFTTGLTEINMGGSTLFLENDKQKPAAAGLFLNKLSNEKYTIAVDRKLLAEPENLVATLVHELCHVKLLGEGRILLNDELLTDLAAAFFGFGVFNANTSFQFYTQTDRWGYRSIGYMKPPEWGYALALSAFYRKEEKPDWRKYLSAVVKKDFDRSLKYIYKNRDDIFRLDDWRL